MPVKGLIRPIPDVTGAPESWTLGVQKHIAARAGEHQDLRLVDPDGIAHSWALRRLPAPGEKALAIQQSDHSREYALGFSGTIPKGTYGAGTVELRRVAPIEVQEAGAGKIRFNAYDGKVPEQFLLRRTGRGWLLANVTPTRKSERWRKVLEGGKEKMKDIAIEDVRPAPDQYMQPKIDGAHVIVSAEGGKPLRIFSYRDAANKTGIIEHTHKFPGWWKRVPQGMDAVVRAEAFAVGPDGTVAAPQITGGLLNSRVPSSRKAQEERGLTLQLRTLTVDQVGGRKAPEAYGEQLRILKVLEHADSRLRTVPTIRGVEEQKKLLGDVLSGEHPLTSEGVVIRTDKGKVLKAKIRPDYDVYVREIVPGKREGEMGSVRFSLTPKGKIVGAVGSGFSREQRQEMLRNPGRYAGQVMKVVAHGQFSSGALRAPSFSEWHIDKSRVPELEQR